MLIFSELMDSRSLFLTPNADTVYFWAFLDLPPGPLVVETPPTRLGIFDDMWFGWVSDFGLPGADRGQGGQYLLVPPGYDGPLPEGGFTVRHVRTTHVLLIGRVFIDMNEGNDPAPSAARIKEQLKIYPYAPGGVGSQHRQPTWPGGAAGHAGRAAEPTVRGGDRAGDQHDSAQRLRRTSSSSTRWCSWSPPRRSTQSWPASSPRSGSSRARSSTPTPGCAGSSTMQPRSATRRRGPSAWARTRRRLPLLRRRHSLVEHAVRRRLRVHQPAADDHPGGVQPFPNQGARRLHSRTSFFYTATGITPAMCMRLTNVGSQYLLANVDADGEPLDGAKTYRLTPAEGHPGRPVLVTHPLRQPDPLDAADRRSATRAPAARGIPRPPPRPSPMAPPSCTSRPTQPDGIAAGNWIQTDPAKGWFTHPAAATARCQPFFDKTWRPGELELVAVNRATQRRWAPNCHTSAVKTQRGDPS